MQKKLRWQVLDRDGHKCVYCGRGAHEGVTLEIDHQIPRARGGADHIDNLVAACRDCNRGKSDLPLIRFPSKSVHLSPDQYVQRAIKENGLSMREMERDAKRRGHRLPISVIHMILTDRLSNPGVNTIRALAYALRRPVAEVIEVFAQQRMRAA